MRVGHLRQIGFGVLTILALNVPAAVAKEQVVRPQKVWGHLELTFNRVEGALVYYDILDTGEGTHTGRYVNVGFVAVDMTTGIAQGSGVCTAANGDTFNWDCVELPGTGVLTITFNDGTGRYKGATGEVVAHHPIVDPGLFIQYDYEGSGWLKF